MEFLNGPHLKVESPITTDGINLVFNEVTGKKMVKITYFPLTAKRALDNENKFLPTNLKHIITEVPGRTYVRPEPTVDPTIALKQRIAELEAQAATQAKGAKPQKEKVTTDDNL